MGIVLIVSRVLMESKVNPKIAWREPLPLLTTGMAASRSVSQISEYIETQRSHSRQLRDISDA